MAGEKVPWPVDIRVSRFEFVDIPGCKLAMTRYDGRDKAKYSQASLPYADILTLLALHSCPDPSRGHSPNLFAHV